MTTATAGRAARSPGARALRSAGRRARPFLFGLACLLVWELASRADFTILPRSEVPAPTDVVGVLLDQFATTDFWVAVAKTMMAWGAGVAIAAVIAIPLGLLIGSSRQFYTSVRGLIELIRPIPSIAILPLCVLVIGLGFQLKLFLITLGAFWPLLLQSIYGVQDVDKEARDMGRAYGLTRTAIFFRIVLPGSAPYIMTGFRLSAVVALNVVIAIELIVGSTGGLGNIMREVQVANRVPEVYAYIIVSGLIGLIINLGLRRAEHSLLHWHASQRRVTPL